MSWEINLCRPDQQGRIAIREASEELEDYGAERRFQMLEPDSWFEFTFWGLQAVWPWVTQFPHL